MSAFGGKADIDHVAQKHFAIRLVSFDRQSVNGGPPSSAGRGKVFRQIRSPAAAYIKSSEKIRERFPAVKTTVRAIINGDNDLPHRTWW
jgi:hypothetical protein